MTKRLTIFHLLFLFSLSNSLFSQEVKTVRDIGLWMGFDLDWDFKKDWKLKFEQELRTNYNAIQISKSISELTTEYDINKNFDLSACLRYSYDRKKDDRFTHDLRYNFDLKFKADLSTKLKIDYRFRYQNEYENIFTYIPNVETNSNLRNRFRLKYNLEKSSLILVLSCLELLLLTKHLILMRLDFH